MSTPSGMVQSEILIGTKELQFKDFLGRNFSHPKKSLPNILSSAEPHGPGIFLLQYWTLEQLH